MFSRNSRKIIEALGVENARFVGGCVRNHILNKEIEDIDIATKLIPEDVTSKLQAIGAKVIPTGIDHGTVTAVLEKQVFEITTLRKDVATDGRRAVIAYAQSWEEDAQRRDFTMNTLLMDLDGNLFDPTGRGEQDLRNGKVIFVGDPAQRIAEDVLRILRFFRFHAIYGRGEPDAAALSACRNAADKIPELSKERITQEFFKILSVENPKNILGLMAENNVLTDVILAKARISGSQERGPAVIPSGAQEPQDDNTLEVFGHLCDFQTRYGLAAIATRLYMLGKSELLLIPKVFQKDMQAIDKILQLPDLSNDHAVKVAMYKHGRTATAQALMIELATDRVMNGYAPQALTLIQNWDIPDFPLSGDDLMKEGIPQGPELGKELARREEVWITENF